MTIYAVKRLNTFGRRKKQTVEYGYVKLLFIKMIEVLGI